MLVVLSSGNLDFAGLIRGEAAAEFAAGVMSLAGELLGTFVKDLDLSDNYIGDEGIVKLCLHPGLQSLNLTHTNLTYQGAEFISKSPLLRVLDLTGNSVSDKGAQALAKTSLETIYLTNNGIRNEGIAAFADSKQLKKLIMFGNYVTSAGIKALLAKNKSLSFLNLCGNRVDDDCIRELMTSPSLTEVDASFNSFTDNGATLIKELMETSSIQSIDISNNVVKKGLFIAYANTNKPALAPSEIDSKNNSPRKLQ